jgi:hypothetical protein
VSVGDVDAGSGTISTVVSAVNGDLTFSLAGGAGATGNGTGSVTLTGTVAQVNAALATLTYNSDDGFTGADTISVLTSDGGNTGSGGTLQSNGGVANTFQVGVVPQVFIIDNNNATADDANSGTSTNPFNSIASFNTLAGDGTGDYIYVRNGTGTYSEADGFDLLNNQQLWGQGQTLQFVNPVTGEVVTIGTGSSGTTPTISITGSGNHAVDLGQGNTLTGLNLATTLANQTAVSDGGGTVGSLTVSDVDVTGTGMAVDVDQGGTLNVALGTLSSSGSSQQGVQLAGTALSGTFTATTGAISGSTGTGFLVGDGSGTANTGGTVAISYGGNISSSGTARTVDIEDRSAGAGTVTLSGTLTHSSGNGTGVFIDDIAAGAISLSGSNTFNTGTAVAIQITDATGGSVTFSGSLDIDTTSGTGINLSGNTVASSFTGSQVTINTTSGAGVNVSGNSGTVSFNNAGNGLDIVTAGATGFAASSSGTITIQGSSNSISTTTGTALNVSSSTIGAAGLNFLSISASGGTNGIVLSNTGSTGALTVTGSGLANSGGTIQNTTGDGIDVLNGMFNLARMLIQNIAGHGIDAANLVGTNTLSNSTISGFDSGGANSENGLNVINTSSTLGSLTVSGTTFSNGSAGNDGIFIEAQGNGNMTVSVSGSTFTGLFGDGLQANGITGATGTVRLTVSGSTFTSAVAGTGNGGISMNPFGDINFIADINGNTFTDIMRPVTNLGAIGMTNGETADADVTIRNNTLSDIEGARGITITADGGTTDLLIDNNTVNSLGSTSKSAINVNFTNNPGLGTVGTGNVTVSNNDIGQTGALWTAGDANANAVLLQALAGASMIAAVTNNVVDANTNSVFEVVRLRASDSGTINGTVTGNDIQDTATATHAEFDATAGTSTLAGTVNLNISGNNLNAGGVLLLTENTAGTINVTQASSAAVSTANGGATVTVTGTPTFGAGTPPLPSTPSLPLWVLGEPSGSGTAALTEDQFLSVVSAAVQRWASAGLSQTQYDVLSHLTFAVVNMDGANIGASAGSLVLVDDDAGGLGWFVDATPLDDSEFSAVTSATHLLAATDTAAQGVDLLTAVMHEIGHTLGLSDSYAVADMDALMYGYLSAGERRLPPVEVEIVGSQLTCGTFSDVP